MTDTATTPGHPALNRRAVGAVVLGNALEFYDFTLYAFFAVPIGAAFFPSADPTDSLLASLALFGIGYVMRPVGGILIGAFADRAGRKPAMLITIALMAVGMLMLALAPGYATIGGWAQVDRHRRPADPGPGARRRGRALHGLPARGGPAAAPRLRGELADRQPGLRRAVCRPRRHPAHARPRARRRWRIGAGASCSCSASASCRSASSSAATCRRPRARARIRQRPRSTGAVVMRLLREHGRLLLLTFVVIAASTVSNAIGTNMPVYARATLGLTETVSTAVPIALGLASVVFPLLGGWLADRFGRRPVLVWPRAAIVVAGRARLLVAGAGADRGVRLRGDVPDVGPVLDQRGGDHRRDPRIAAAGGAKRRPVDRLRLLGLDLRRQHELRGQQADRGHRRSPGAGLLPRRLQRPRHGRRADDARDPRPDLDADTPA